MVLTLGTIIKWRYIYHFWAYKNFINTSWFSQYQPGCPLWRRSNNVLYFPQSIDQSMSIYIQNHRWIWLNWMCKTFNLGGTFSHDLSHWLTQKMVYRLSGFVLSWTARESELWKHLLIYFESFSSSRPLISQQATLYTLIDLNRDSDNLHRSWSS